MNFKYAYKTFYFIMDSTHKYVVVDVSKNYSLKDVTVSLKTIDDAQSVSPSYCPRWRSKLIIEPVYDDLLTIMTAIKMNQCTFCIDHKSIKFPDPAFEIITVSEEIDCIVESQEAIQQTLKEEKELQLALKRKQFEEFTNKLDFEKLSIGEIDKLTKVITGKY